MIIEYFPVKDLIDKFEDAIEVVEDSQEKLVELVEIVEDSMEVVENSIEVVQDSEDKNEPQWLWDKADILRSMLKILFSKFY